MSGEFACRKELPKNYSGQILDGKYPLAGCKGMNCFLFLYKSELSQGISVLNEKLGLTFRAVDLWSMRPTAYRLITRLLFRDYLST